MEKKFKRGDRVNYLPDKPERESVLTFLFNQKTKFKSIY